MILQIQWKAENSMRSWKFYEKLKFWWKWKIRCEVKNELKFQLKSWSLETFIGLPCLKYYIINHNDKMVMIWTSHWYFNGLLKSFDWLQAERWSVSL